jgi:hypothetical protein
MIGPCENACLSAGRLKRALRYGESGGTIGVLWFGFSAKSESPKPFITSCKTDARHQACVKVYHTNRSGAGGAVNSRLRSTASVSHVVPLRKAALVRQGSFLNIRRLFPRIRSTLLKNHVFELDPMPKPP